MTANKFKGYCAGCAVNVAAGEGIYNGNVWCEEPKRGYDFGFNDSTTACRRYHEREERARVAADTRRVEYEASPEYAAIRAEADEKSRARADVERALNARGLKTCNRCGGAGRSDLWHATGYTCFDCEGRGSVPMSERELRKAKKNAVATA